MTSLSARCSVEVEVDLIPQGSSRRCRAGGAGITVLHAGWLWSKWRRKEVREFNGKPHILKRLTADFAFVKAWKGDTAGNLVYKATARNFNSSGRR